MRTKYPSKSFLSNVSIALERRDELEISIFDRWKRKILGKEVVDWLPVNEIGLLEKGWRGPSNWCGVFMPTLHAAHYMVLSADYELKVKLESDRIVLTYVPLGRAKTKRD